ncbi:MAG: hypothetical protein JWL83_1016 [Actinomycetia bacterium]|nr:hypothetical protein [Actinomycetes bacterium]
MIPRNRETGRGAASVSELASKRTPATTEEEQ